MKAPPRNVFWPVLAALLLVVLSGVAAMRASSMADDYHPSLNVVDPPLSRVAPHLGEGNPPLSRRVVLVIIDGLRLRDSFGVPTLDGLRRQGVDAVARSHYPTISRPNHTTIVTGVPPLLSGVRNNKYNRPVKIDSLMDRIQAARMRAAYIGDYAKGLAFMFTGDLADIHFAMWPQGLIRSARINLEDDYELVILLPGSVDMAGHNHGGDSDEYREAVQYVDSQLATILKFVDLEKDSIVITADHGHTDKGGHGGTEKVVLEVPLIMAGAGIVPGAVLGERELVDIAPTVAALLGLPPPGHSIGSVITEALQLTPDSAARLRAADKVRRLRNTSVHEKAIKGGRASLASRRLYRLVIVGGAALLIVSALFFARRVGAIYIDWRVLVIALPAFPLCYYALIHLLGQNISLSAIPDRGETMERLFDFGLVSTAAYVIAGWIALRGRVVLRDRLAAANALALCGGALAWIPAAILWAIYDVGPHLEIGGSSLLVLVPATYVAVAAYAIGVAVLLGLELIVFFARAIDPRIRLNRLERAAERERRRLENEP